MTSETVWQSRWYLKKRLHVKLRRVTPTIRPARIISRIKQKPLDGWLLWLNLPFDRVLEIQLYRRTV